MLIRGGTLHETAFKNDQTKMESRTPFRGDLPAGTYTVRFELGGYMSATRTVTVSTNRTLDLAAVLERSRGPEEDRPWTIPELGTEMLPIPAGGFVMGSPADERGHAADEDPSTRVMITRPFWLGKYDVTQKEWRVLMEDNPSKFRGDDRPVEQVAWARAMEFCSRLTQRERDAGRLPEGYAYSLPTEAQGEYACRAGTTGPYAGNLDDLAWYSGTSGDQTHPVGQKRPNAWGLYDMHGNVWQ